MSDETTTRRTEPDHAEAERIAKQMTNEFCEMSVGFGATLSDWDRAHPEWRARAIALVEAGMAAARVPAVGGLTEAEVAEAWDQTPSPDGLPSTFTTAMEFLGDNVREVLYAFARTAFALGQSRRPVDADAAREHDREVARAALTEAIRLMRVTARSDLNLNLADAIEASAVQWLTVFRDREFPAPKPTSVPLSDGSVVTADDEGVEWIRRGIPNSLPRVCKPEHWPLLVTDLTGADFAYGEFANRRVVLLHLPDGVRIGADIRAFADAARKAMLPLPPSGAPEND